MISEDKAITVEGLSEKNGKHRTTILRALAKTNALFSEQIAMRAGSNQRQDKSIALNLVDEEPIRLIVAFSE